ncbi:T9SS type A sorting domain-containing protein [Candidatus Amoebophilus asiaticus]|nr:T9SS type A sorting domain-containing protein [Candidatus Amoebophilus asiaticus]
MKKKYIYGLVFFMVIGLMFISNSVVTYTTGPPAAMTGAPGESTCGNSSCHNTAANTGIGSPAISFTGGLFYVPGQTYTIQVSVTEPPLSKFGFQLVALKDVDNTNTGTITVTDLTNTLMLTSGGKTFIEHSSAGTVEAIPGAGIWSFDWTAPTPAVGTITFYMASLATNSNGSSTGDNLYTTSLTIGCATGISSIVTTTFDLNCNGSADGFASVAVIGGVLPYTFSWSNSSTDSFAINLSAGNYDVTISDAGGCDTVLTINLNEPTALSLFTSSTEANCGNSDGTATVSVSGGTSPYSINWSSGGTTTTTTGLSGGSYTVTITDGNSCVSTAVVNVNNPGLPGISITEKINVSCFGGSDGSAKASASGGLTPYAFSWSTSPVQTTWLATGLAADIYNFTLTDSNGCVSIMNVTIIQPATLNDTITGTNSTCFNACDGTASISVSGGVSPYYFSWDIGDTTSSISGLCFGTFNVTVTDDNGCIISNSTTVTEPDSISLSMSTTNETQARDDGLASVSAAGGTLPYTYSWSNGGTDSLITGLAAGTYTITVTDANGCMAIASDSVGIDLGFGTIGNQHQMIKIYPNPANQRLFITFDQSRISEYDFVIYNMMGDKVHVEKIHAGKIHQVDLSQLELKGGIYFIHLQNQQISEIRKIILTE